jgi:crotonobetainyl-CoA:carnitine CoA-transferase CaiB-like acyl-CoA transferase
MTQVLAGIRVLDMSNYVAGPYCAKILGDYGAEVIKVEEPGLGDISRRLGPFPDDDPHPEKSALFLHLNTSKKGITLDFRTTTGAEILRKLIANSDVIIESYGSSKLAEYGLDYPNLAQINPRLVMTSITPFGPYGPYKDYQATDIILAALGGWMYPLGDPDREPLQPGGPYIQYVTGVTATVGTLLALFRAMLTGEGKHVNVAALEVAAATTVYDMVRYSYNGEVRSRHGHLYGLGSRGSISISLQEGQDGYFLHMGGPNREGIFALLGKPELSEDPRF